MRIALLGSKAWVVVQVLVVSLLVSGLAQAQPRTKKKDGKKPAAAAKADPEQPKESTPKPAKNASPFRDMVTLLEQAPSFDDFPKPAYQATLAIVVALGKDVLFLDGCQATITRKNWTVSQCKAARASEGDMLTKLALMGGDTSSDPANATKLNDLLALLKRVKTLGELDGLMAPSVDVSKTGYKPTPEMEKDFETCGAKRYADALASMPSVTGLGENVVMLDMSYGLYSSRPVLIRFVAGRTTQGWKLSKLRISCQP